MFCHEIFNEVVYTGEIVHILPKEVDATFTEISYEPHIGKISLEKPILPTNVHGP